MTVPAALDLPDTCAPSTRPRLFLLLMVVALLMALRTAAVPAKANAAGAHPGSTTSQNPAAGPLLTDNDTVLLAEFENKTGDPAFDDALQEALALELEQSPFLNILSDRKVGEALRATGRSANDLITPDVSRDLCLRAGSKLILGGSLAKQRSRYLLELSAVDCRSGNTWVNERSEVASNAAVLKVLSQTSRHLRSMLGESPSSVRQFAVPIEVTTSSLEALKIYRIGITVRRNQGDTPSIAYLKRAIELDPKFPLPYAELTAIYGNIRQPSQALDFANKAYRLRDRVGEREKLKIAGIYLLATGDLEKEIQTYEQWQAKYPRDFVPYNNLGNDYAAMGQLDRSLAEYSQALHLMPSVISYTNVVGMDLSLNRFDAAGAMLDEAAAAKLDGRYLHQNRYWLAFLRGDIAQMEQQLSWASAKPGDEDALLSMQSDTEAYAGRLAKAQDFTHRAVDSAVRAGSKETAALWLVNAALRSAEVGNVALAEQEVDSALALSAGRDVKLIAAFTLARAGENRRAKTLSAELLQLYPTDVLMRRYWLPALDGSVDLNTGDFARALERLQAAGPYELGGAGTFINYLYPAYVRGQAYLLAHDASAAAGEFQKLLDHSGIVINFVTGALAHLELGRAYAMAGDRSRAKAAYQDFFALWKDADAQIPILNRAKQEYATLEPRHSQAFTAPGNSTAIAREVEPGRSAPRAACALAAAARRSRASCCVPPC